MTSTWRGPVNQLLFSLSYSKDITDEMIRFNADSAVNYTTLSLGPDVYRWAIGEALASGERLDGVPKLPQFDQQQIAAFLRGVADRLDELRPWPDPKVRPLHPATWGQFGHAKPIARLEASVVKVTGILQKGFRPVDDEQSGQQVLMLRLETGETIALLGSYGRGQKVTLSTDAAGDPDEVIEHFTTLTGFPAEKVVRI